jgi:Uma2 family endonuclease
MVTKSPATYKDVLDAPDDKVAELIDGELFLSSRPTSYHAGAASNLAALLIPRFWHGDNGPGGWVIVIEPELHLAVDKRVVVPDLAGWRTSRMSSLPEDHKFKVVPDWICEIASKKTRKHDRKNKLPLYARVGVGHAWIIEPRLRSLQGYRRHEQNWLELGCYFDDEKVRAEPFDAVELDLSRLWLGQALPTRASEGGADEDFEEYDY